MLKKSTIRRVGSLFFLGIFLWFYSVKDIHDVAHAEDLHCHVKNAKHLHTGEHHCPVCDFQFPSIDDKTSNIEVPSDNFFFKAENIYTVQAISCEPVSFFSSRAPPVVA